MNGENSMAVVPIRKAGTEGMNSASIIEIDADELRVKLPAGCPAELICAMLRELRS